MTNLSSGAVGFAPVGTFVKDLALELGKAPATLVAYLKKHLPATLTKRKNANKRLANFVTEDGVAGLRAHYTPTSAPAEVEGELQRLREENARLRERVQELEAEVQALDCLELDKPIATATRKLLLTQRRTFELVTRSEVNLENDVRAGYDLPPLTIEEYKDTLNGKFTYQKTQSSTRKDSGTRGSQSKVVSISSGRKTTS